MRILANSSVLWCCRAGVLNGLGAIHGAETMLQLQLAKCQVNTSSAIKGKPGNSSWCLK